MQGLQERCAVYFGLWPACAGEAGRDLASRGSGMSAIEDAPGKQPAPVHTDRASFFASLWAGARENRHRDSSGEIALSAALGWRILAKALAIA